MNAGIIQQWMDSGIRPNTKTKSFVVSNLESEITFTAAAAVAADTAVAIVGIA